MIIMTKVEKVFRRLLWGLVRRWAYRQHDVALVFTRYDGVSVDVSCCACGACKNYFFAQHVAVEAPKCCPFCCQTFSGIVDVGKDEMRQIQIL
jgi:hypothetical protein